jgi:hypothetical protein
MTKAESAEVKEWLWKYRDDLRELRRLGEELKQVIESQEGARAIVYDGMPGGGSKGHEDLSSLMALRERYEEKIDRINQLMASHLKERLEVIDSLTSPAQREVISMRYIQLTEGRAHGWNDIAMSTGYSQQYIYDIHGKALESIGLMIGEKRKEKKTPE